MGTIPHFLAWFPRKLPLFIFHLLLVLVCFFWTNKCRLMYPIHLTLLPTKLFLYPACNLHVCRCDNQGMKREFCNDQRERRLSGNADCILQHSPQCCNSIILSQSFVNWDIGRDEVPTCAVPKPKQARDIQQYSVSQTHVTQTLKHLLIFAKLLLRFHWTAG